MQYVIVVGLNMPVRVAVVGCVAGAPDPDRRTVIGQAIEGPA